MKNLLFKLKNIFSEKEKNVYTEQKDIKNVLKNTLNISDMVVLKFKHPEEIGFKAKDGSAFMRFNTSDYPERIISGIISNKFENNLIKEHFIEITHFIKRGDRSTEKKVLLLESEIEWIKLV